MPVHIFWNVGVVEEVYRDRNAFAQTNQRPWRVAVVSGGEDRLSGSHVGLDQTNAQFYIGCPVVSRESCPCGTCGKLSDGRRGSKEKAASRRSPLKQEPTIW
jgi:hypothetical protein